MTIRDEVEQAVAHLTELVTHLGMSETLSRLERRLIEVALEISGQDCNAAAKRLGLNRTTLVEKRRRYKMPLRPRLG